MSNIQYYLRYDFIHIFLFETLFFQMEHSFPAHFLGIQQKFSKLHPSFCKNQFQFHFIVLKNPKEVNSHPFVLPSERRGICWRYLISLCKKLKTHKELTYEKLMKGRR
eukprot:TRINITY_DN29136_c0_g1_i2.p2 TRINITY_DN29136_c0_g1~~TRINITY_DN29136_c0_g1_i2.p2  ORF type:complete len:108 (+),score=3.67 TRINITY_DN29136_c0_g1_i2:312-635(+)